MSAADYEVVNDLGTLLFTSSDYTIAIIWATREGHRRGMTLHVERVVRIEQRDRLHVSFLATRRTA